MPTQSELKTAAASKLMAVLTQNITFNGNSYAYYWVSLPDWVGLAVIARLQDPTALRTVAIQSGSIYDAVEMTNAAFVAMVDSLLVERQKAYDAYKAASDAIDANTITDYGALDTAWDTSITNYTPPTSLPSVTDLADDKSDKATAFNTLLTKVTAHETAINALKGAGAA